MVVFHVCAHVAGQCVPNLKLGLRNSLVKPDSTKAQAVINPSMPDNHTYVILSVQMCSQFLTCPLVIAVELCPHVYQPQTYWSFVDLEAWTQTLCWNGSVFSNQSFFFFQSILEPVFANNILQLKIVGEKCNLVSLVGLLILKVKKRCWRSLR